MTDSLEIMVNQTRQLELALKTIAEYPTPEQDNIISANMRKIAQDALKGDKIDNEV